MPESTTTRAWRADSIEGPAAPVGPEAREQPPRGGRAGGSAGRAECGADLSRLRRLGAAVARAGRATWSRTFGRRAARFEGALHRFTVEVGASTNPEAIELALVRLAERIMPSGRFELIRATGEPACCKNWQVAFPMGTGAPPGEDAGMRPGESLDEIPLRCGTADHGVLRVHALAAGDRPLTGEQMHRRLTTACTLAACALENARLQAEWSWGDGDEKDEEWTADPATDADGRIRTPCEQPDVVLDATFLNAVLPFALGQSRRHGEPVSLLCLQLDRLGAMRDLLGPAIADGLLQDLARTVASVVRSSDIVARLDDDRIVALLVRARGADAIRVARTIGRAVAESGLGSPRLPGASVSIGVAEFPATARDAASLLDTADEAMSRARARGSNAAVLAEPRAGHSPAHAPATAARPAMSSCTR